MWTMEYRGIDFAVRARPGRNEWLWTISPKQGPAITGQFSGTRDEALAAARRSRRASDRSDEKIVIVRGAL